VGYGEGPHIIALTLIPLAIIALRAALRRRSYSRAWIAAIAVAVVPLTNWIGAAALAVTVLAMLLALPGGRLPYTFAKAAVVGGLAYALASPWLPPSSIVDIQRNAQLVVGHYPMAGSQFLYDGLLLAVVAGVWVLFRKLRVSEILRFSTLYLLLMGGITFSGPWFGTYAVPQPERYHLEMEMGVVLFVVFAFAALCRRLPGGLRLTVGLAVFALLITQTTNARAFALRQIQPVEIQKTVEYEIARWFSDNLPGRRVFVEGSTRFWLNVFSDNPQIGGATDQAIVNTTSRK
jgi:hypothetical protein